METVEGLATPSSESRHPISLFRLLLLHLRVGNLTFGGGDPSLAALHTEMVGTHQWITSEQYAVVFALARITPGTNLLAFCAGISWMLLGWVGAWTAVLAMTAPAAIVVVLLTRSYAALEANSLAMAAFGGVLAAAIGMMPAAAWQLARPYLRWGHALHAMTIVVGACVLSLWGATSPVQILGLAAVVGFFWWFSE